MPAAKPQFDVTLVTHAALPAGSPDDVILAGAIRRQGLSLRLAVWNDPLVNWRESSVALVRSTWDYHYSPLAWLHWIDSVRKQTRLINSPALLAWSSDKHYLRDLQAAGIAIVPTWFVEQGEVPGVPDASSSDWIIKPAIGASARGVKRFPAKDLMGSGLAYVKTLTADGAALLQPYMKALEHVQERSLVFIGGQYTHAFTKPSLSTDASGQTAVQLCYPSDAELGLARAAIATLAEPALYARADIVPADNGPLLMELELIEPDLAFRLHPAGATRLAQEVGRMLK